jgi:hypothetical protein
VSEVLILAGLTMGVRSHGMAACAVFALTPVLPATAQDKVPYHVNDTASQARFTPSGVVRLTKLQRDGFAYLKPSRATGLGSRLQRGLGKLRWRNARGSG